MNDEIAGQAILNATIRQLVFILMDTASFHILNRDTPPAGHERRTSVPPRFFYPAAAVRCNYREGIGSPDTGRDDPRSQHSETISGQRYAERSLLRLCPAVKRIRIHAGDALQRTLNRQLYRAARQPPRDNDPVRFAVDIPDGINQIFVVIFQSISPAHPDRP